jgi:hypothetical protein
MPIAATSNACDRRDLISQRRRITSGPINPRTSCPPLPERLQAVHAILTHRVNPPAALILAQHDAFLPTRHSAIGAANLGYQERDGVRHRVTSSLENGHAGVGNLRVDPSDEVRSDLDQGGVEGRDAMGCAGKRHEFGVLPLTRGQVWFREVEVRLGRRDAQLCRVRRSATDRQQRDESGGN